jgi:hypothetical protein
MKFGLLDISRGPQSRGMSPRASTLFWATTSSTRRGAFASRFGT